MPDLSASPLAALQTRIQSYVLGDAADMQPVLPLLRARSTGKEAGPGTACRGLQIYHSAYRSRLRDALGAVFERTWAYLGDDEFDTLCARHIEADHSTWRNLRDYGSAFPAMLHQALPDDAEAAELATMDWRLHLAFDAPDATQLTPAQLSALSEADWERARLILHPSVSLAVFEWNVLDVWHALDQGLQPPAVRRLPAPIAHLFWRSEHRARFRTLTPGEHAALRGIGDGMCFGDVCECVAREHADADFGELIGSWLGRWVADELLSACRTAPDGSRRAPAPSR